MNPFYRPFTTIRGKFFLLLLGALVPILAIEGYYQSIHFRERQTHEFASNLEMARAAAGTFEEYVRSMLQQELAIGIHLTFPNPPDISQMNRILRQNKEAFPEVRNFSWVSPQGRVIAASMESTIGIDISDRPYLRETLAGKEWAVSNLIKSKATGEPIFVITRGIRDEQGRLLGIVLAAIHPEKAGEMLKVERINEGAITLIDKEGKAVFQYPTKIWEWEQRIAISDLPALRRAIAGEEIAATVYGSFDGVKRIRALSPVATCGWVVCASRPVHQVMQPIISRALHETGLYALLVAAVFAVAIFLSQRIVAPLRRLHRHAKNLGRGNPMEKLELTGSGELRDLAAAFNTMAEEVGKREKALEGARQRLSALLEAMPACVYLQGPDYLIHFSNRTFRETFGDPEGKTCHEILRGKKQPCADCTVSSPFYSRIPREVEWTSPGGRIYRVHDRPFDDMNGSPLMLKVGVDITELKAAEQALRKEKRFVQSIVETAQSIMLLLDPEGCIVYFNPFMEELSGYRLGEVMGKDWFTTFLPEKDRNPIREVFSSSIGDLPTMGNINSILTGDGEERCVDWYDKTLKDADGHIMGLLCIGYDITERLKAEKTLRASEEKYRSIFSAARDAIIILDHETGKIIDVNEYTCRLYGYSRGEMLLLKNIDLSAEPDKTLAALKSEVNWLPLRYHRKKDGTVFPVEISVNYHSHDGRRISTSVIRDITERKKTEEALRESEEKYRTIFENSPLGIIFFNDRGNIADCNAKLVEIMGRPREEIVAFEALIEMKDEKMLEALVSSLSGRPGHYEMDYHHTRREKITPLKADFRPIHDENGSVTGVIAMFEDISDRKKAEKALAESEAQLRHLSARLFAAQEEERKRIAGELHDSIGQSLAAMKFTMENTIQNPDRNNPREAFGTLEFLVPFIQNAIEEIRAIYTGLRPPILDKLGVIATINWFCRDFQKIYPMHHLEIAFGIEEKDISEELKIVVFRVMQEALNNMAKYSRAERVEISLSNTGGMILLHIADNGEGFDPGAADRKGLGLSSMRERVELSGGRFSLDSAPGKGTDIRAEWPM